jgi:hypothetical protein
MPEALVVSKLYKPMADPQPFCDLRFGYRIILAPDWRTVFREDFGSFYTEEIPGRLTYYIGISLNYWLDNYLLNFLFQRSSLGRFG